MGKTMMSVSGRISDGEISAIMRRGMSVCNSRLTAVGGTYRAHIDGIFYDLVMQTRRFHDEDVMFFNATAIVREYNANHPGKKKQLTVFMKRKRTNQIIKSLAKLYGLKETESENFHFQFFKRNGKANERWLHRDLFEYLMIWLDHENEVAVVEQTRKAVLMSSSGAETRQVSRRLARAETDGLKVLREMLIKEGSGAEKFLYSNFNKWLIEAVTGEKYSKFLEGVKEKTGRDHLNHDVDLDRWQNERMAQLRLMVNEQILLRIAQGWTGKQIYVELRDFLKSRVAS